jgi:hypothetical protein
VAALAIMQMAAPAYAVTSNQDGSLTVTINNIGDPGEANKILRDAGVRAVVLVPKSAEDCPVEDRTPAATDSVLGAVEFDRAAGPNVNKILIHPDKIPAGTVLALSAVTYPHGPGFSIGMYPEPGPKCVVALS